MNFALFGFPLAHSVSPSLYYYLTGGMPHQGQYFLLSARHDVLLPETFRRFGLVGANVTSPLKQSFMNQLDEITVEARGVGAINTIVATVDGFSGHNTDVVGVRQMLTGLEFDFRERPVLLLGAGGAAASVVYVLRELGARVYVMNRSPARGEALAQRFGACFLASDRAEELRDCALVFSCLPAGASLPALDWTQFDFVLDATYRNSPLAGMEESLGSSYISGLEWLFYQARATYEVAFGLDMRTFRYEDWLESGPAVPLRIEEEEGEEEVSLPGARVQARLVALGTDLEERREILSYERRYGLAG